jgi:hypothetical protein
MVLCPHGDQAQERPSGGQAREVAGQVAYPGAPAGDRRAGSPRAVGEEEERAMTARAAQPVTAWAAFCPWHRALVGADDRDALVQWTLAHMRAQGCPAVELDLTAVIIKKFGKAIGRSR